MFQTLENKNCARRMVKKLDVVWARQTSMVWRRGEADSDVLFFQPTRRTNTLLILLPGPLGSLRNLFSNAHLNGCPSLLFANRLFLASLLSLTFLHVFLLALLIVGTGLRKVVELNATTPVYSKEIRHSPSKSHAVNVFSASRNYTTTPSFMNPAISPPFGGVQRPLCTVSAVLALLSCSPSRANTGRIETANVLLRQIRGFGEISLKIRTK